MFIRKIIDAFKIKNKINPLIISRTLLCLIILITGVALFFLLTLLKSKPAERAGDDIIKTLITIPAQKTDYKVKVTGYGTTKPGKTMTISSQINGPVEYISDNLRDGNLVKKGELLLKIDKSDYEIALRKANAEIQVYESEYAIHVQLIKDYKEMLRINANNVRLEKLDFERQKQLHSKKVISSSAYEDAEQKFDEIKNSYLNKRSELSKAELQLHLIKANIDKTKSDKSTAELNIERSKIFSPINGRIKNKNVEINGYVNIGKVLFDIADDSSLSISIALTAADAAEIMQIHPDKTSDYRHWFRYDKNTPVMIQWIDKPDRCKWTGHILRVESFNPETRTVVVVVQATDYVGDKDNIFPLVDGMFCKVTLTGKELKDVMLIPWSAIQLNNNIYVVDKAGIIHERNVEIKSSNDGKAIISSNFKDGDRIVVQQISRGIVNGMKVNTVNANEIMKTN